MKHFPEEKISHRIYPSDINEHMKGLWCDVRNSIQKDQEGVLSSLRQIASLKKQIKFLKERTIVNLNALDAIEGIK